MEGKTTADLALDANPGSSGCRQSTRTSQNWSRLAGLTFEEGMENCHQAEDFLRLGRSGESTFDYQVRDRTGKGHSRTYRSGVAFDRSPQAQGMGLRTVAITQANSGLKTEIKMPGFGNRVKLKMAVSTQQFSTMINSGLSATCLDHSQAARPKMNDSVRSTLQCRLSLGKDPRCRSIGCNPVCFPDHDQHDARAGRPEDSWIRFWLNSPDNFEAKSVALDPLSRPPVVVFTFALISPDGHVAVHLSPSSQTFSQDSVANYPTHTGAGDPVQPPEDLRSGDSAP